MNTSENDIKNILLTYKKFTVYGLSPDGSKPSQRVPLFMKSKGYDAVGVYPKGENINGFPIYSSLMAVPAEYRKFVDVFRSPDHILQVVDEVLAVGGVEVLWLQLGISHPEAEARAEKAGLKVVSNRCLHIEYEKFFK